MTDELHLLILVHLRGEAVDLVVFVALIHAIIRTHPSIVSLCSPMNPHFI